MLFIRFQIERTKFLFRSTARQFQKNWPKGTFLVIEKAHLPGAVNDSPGMIRAADGGTLFLDEVGDLPIDVQPKLLRFLQEGEVQPIGEKRPIKVDVRVIAATNMPLEEKVANGTFREDLYYRLNVIRLRVPPLRERRSEIPSMVALLSRSIFAAIWQTWDKHHAADDRPLDGLRLGRQCPSVVQ